MSLRLAALLFHGLPLGLSTGLLVYVVAAHRRFPKV